MITDEEKRNGKLPGDRRKKTNGTCSTTSRIISRKGKKVDNSVDNAEKSGVSPTPKRSIKRKKPVIEDTENDSRSESEEVNLSTKGT